MLSFSVSFSNITIIKVMASRNTPMTLAQSLIPIFKREIYDFWSIRMKTILAYPTLWNLIESGFVDPNEGNRLWNNKQKDARWWCLSSSPSMIASFHGLWQQPHQNKLGPFCERNLKMIRRSLWWDYHYFGVTLKPWWWKVENLLQIFLSRAVQ